MSFKQEDFNWLSDAELQELMELIQNERTRRENEAREKLISNFQKAFYDLRDAHIVIRYDDYDEDFYLEDWDRFEFG